MATAEQITLIPLDPAIVVADYDAYKVSLSGGGSRSATNRASELGFPCDAYIPLSRLRGEAKPAPGPKLAAIFDEGRHQERQIARDLMGMGYDVSESQKMYYWDRYKISGHQDFTISKPGFEPVRAEFKSLNPFLWESLNSEQEVRNHRWVTIRKYAAQCDLYMLLEGEDSRWFVIKNKSTGQIKIIVLHLDLDNAEALLQRAERVNAAVRYAEDNGYEAFERERLPAMRVNDAEYCDDCPFAALCLPNVDFGLGVALMEEEEFVAALETRERTAEAAKLHEEADKRVKEIAKATADAGHSEILAGGYRITWKKLARKGYSVEPTEYWRTTIKREAKGA